MTLDEAFNLCLAHQKEGRLNDAISVCQSILNAAPNLPQALHLMGILQGEAGRLQQGSDYLKKSISLNPNNPSAHLNLGTLLQNLGQIEQAVESYLKAIALNPVCPEAYNNLGLNFFNMGDPARSLQYFQKAAEQAPNDPLILTNYGHALATIGRFDAAIPCHQKAISLAPDFAGAHNNLGFAYKQLGNMEKAKTCFKKAIALDPAYAMPRINLSAVFLIEGFPDLAVQCLQEALKCPTDIGMMYNNLGNAYTDMGRFSEAVESYRKALLAQPPYPPAWHNYLYGLNFLDNVTPEKILEEHLNWNRSLPRPAIPQKREIPSDDRPLKIGFVSPEFRFHPVGRFFLPLIQNLDPQRVQTFCYSDCDAADYLTENIRRASTAFRPVQGFSHQKLAQTIRDDKIDILVDLNQHMACCRLETFLLQPAPVQVAWLGYCGTTGLSEIPWRLTDPFLDPPGLFDSHYCEKNIYLPVCYWCYAPIHDCPPAKIKPANSTPTFGCLNNFCKIRETTLDLWKSLLLQIPNSKMLLLAPEGSSRQQILDRLRGVDPARVQFVNRGSYLDYFELYNRIDIALDPFPYGGGTTTCDALWMNVPVVTLAGNRAVSRAGLSLLSAVGLPQLIADSPEKYISIAAQLANDPDARRQLSLSLRDRMIASPLMDAKRFASDFESAMRLILRQARAQTP